MFVNVTVYIGLHNAHYYTISVFKHYCSPFTLLGIYFFQLFPLLFISVCCILPLFGTTSLLGDSVSFFGRFRDTVWNSSLPLTVSLRPVFFFWGGRILRFGSRPLSNSLRDWRRCLFKFIISSFFFFFLWRRGFLPQVLLFSTLKALGLSPLHVHQN